MGKTYKAGVNYNRSKQQLQQHLKNSPKTDFDFKNKLYVPVFYHEISVACSVALEVVFFS